MNTYIEYRSLQDLGDALLRNLHRFPHNADLIVGIPRSGMLSASLLSLYLNKPLTDIDSFVNGHIYATGNRGKSIEDGQSGLIIVVDDTVSSGKAMNAAKAKLASINYNFNYFYATVYATSEGRNCIDCYCEIINGPRIFQWNLFHEVNMMAKTCMDIDGVLCPNPPIDDDGNQYLNYISHAKPLIIPSVEINTLVSCRLEKYRSATEMWLHLNGVKYKKLIMLDLPTKEARIKWGMHGEYKGEIYMKSNCELFVESSKDEALRICNVSGKQVFCIETLEMLYGGHTYLSKSITKSMSLVRKIVKKALPNTVQRWLKQNLL